MRKITIIDTTMRDGSHAIAHTYTPEKIAAITKGLADAGCRKIEVGHGDGLEGSSIQYGFGKTDEYELMKAAVANKGDATIGTLLIPGIGTIKALDKMYEIGVRSVRVATHVTEADTGAEHIRHAKSIGMEAVGFLMMSHMREADTIVEQAKLFESYGADIIYLADSAGAMIPQMVVDRIKALKENVSLPIGFHAHNNLGLAIGNSLAAVEAGCDYIDGTLIGLGAGAGNAPHEVLQAVLDKAGYDTGEKLYPLMDVAEEEVRSMGVSMDIDKYALTIGYAGVYSSFFLHAKRAADKYHLDARDILAELGRMKTVGGQEDMILDVAYRMALERGILK